MQGGGAGRGKQHTFPLQVPAKQGFLLTPSQIHKTQRVVHGCGGQALPSCSSEMWASLKGGNQVCRLFFLVFLAELCPLCHRLCQPWLASFLFSLWVSFTKTWKDEWSKITGPKVSTVGTHPSSQIIHHAMWCADTAMPPCTGPRNALVWEMHLLLWVPHLHFLQARVWRSCCLVYEHFAAVW